MFLRCKVRRKDGKQHRYWSVVENTRTARGRVVQRHVLYLGEINDTQELAWRRSIEVLEDGATQPRDAVAVSGRSLRRSAGGRLDCPRQAVAVAVCAGRGNGAHAGWRCCCGRELQARSVLVEAAGVEPQRNALGSGPVRAGCLSLAGAGQRMAAAPRVVPAQCLGRSAGRGRRAGPRSTSCTAVTTGCWCTKQAVFDHLTGRWRDLFNISYDVLLYDLTSTYFEADPRFRRATSGASGIRAITGRIVCRSSLLWW